MLENITFTAAIDSDSDHITVRALLADAAAHGVDRDEVAAWGLPRTQRGWLLARRLAGAIEAGAATPPREIRTDVNGRTYLDTAKVIIGRRMNACLYRLGF